MNRYVWNGEAKSLCHLNRYVWNGEAKYLYKTEDFNKDNKFAVPFEHKIFVNIVKRIIDNGIIKANVKLYYADGTVLEGWTIMNNNPLCISDIDELFDGRFNV